MDRIRAGEGTGGERVVRVSSRIDRAEEATRSTAGRGVRRRREEEGKRRFGVSSAYPSSASHLETLPHDLRRQRLPLGFLRGRRARSSVYDRRSRGSERGGRSGDARDEGDGLNNRRQGCFGGNHRKNHVWARTVGSSAECSCGALMLMSTSVSVAATHRGRPPLIPTSPVSFGSLAAHRPRAPPVASITRRCRLRLGTEEKIVARAEESRSLAPTILIGVSTRFSRWIRGFDRAF